MSVNGEAVIHQERPPFALHGYGEGDVPLAITESRHDSAFQQLYRGGQGDTHIGYYVVDDPSSGLPSPEILTSRHQGNDTRVLVFGTPGPYYLEPQGVFGVWALEDVPVEPVPVASNELESSPWYRAPESERDREVRHLTGMLKNLYTPGEPAPNLTPEVQTAIRKELLRLGYRQVGKHYSGNLLPLGSRDEITRPFSKAELDLVARKKELTEAIVSGLLGGSGLSEAGENGIANIISADRFGEDGDSGKPATHSREGLLVGPLMEDSPNPGILGVWAPYIEYEQARGVWHIDTEEGYTLDTRPAQVPWEEQLALLKHLVEIRFVPGETVSGKQDTQGLTRAAYSVEELIAMGSAPSLLNKENLLVGVGNGDYIPGPRPGILLDGPGGYRRLVPGETVCFWRKAKGAHDRDTLGRLRYDIRKDNIKPVQ